MKKKIVRFFKGCLKTIVVMYAGMIVLGFLVVVMNLIFSSRIHRDATLLNEHNHEIYRSHYDPWTSYLVANELISHFVRYKNYGIGRTKNTYFVIGAQKKFSTTNKNLFLNNPIVISALKDKVFLNKPYRYFVEHIYRNIRFKRYPYGRKSRKIGIILIPTPDKIKRPYTKSAYQFDRRDPRQIISGVRSYASDKGYIYGTYKDNVKVAYFVLVCNTLKIYKFADKRFFLQKLLSLKLNPAKIIEYSSTIHDVFLKRCWQRTKWPSIVKPIERYSRVTHWGLAYIDGGSYNVLAYAITHLNQEGHLYYGKCRAGWFILDIKKGEYLFYWDKKKFNEELIKLNFSIDLDAVYLGDALNPWDTPPGEALKLQHKRILDVIGNF